MTELGFKEYTAHHGDTFNMVLFTLSLMIGTAGLPHVIMRFFTVPKVADARWSAGWALVFIALLYLTAPAVGAMARLNITELMWPNGTNGEAVSVQQIESEPAYDWMATWQKTGLLGWEDKNGDGKIQYYNDASEAMQEKAAANGWQGNELTNFNRDILVLANPEIANLPSWVIGLVAAGGLAAALSTAAGLLLAISSAVSHDLIKGQLNPSISEKGELLSARIAMAAAIAVATYLGLNPPGVRGTDRCAGFRACGGIDLPGADDGDFLNEDQQSRSRGWHARRSCGDAGLHLPAQRVVLHPGYQQLHRC